MRYYKPYGKKKSAQTPKSFAEASVPVEECFAKKATAWLYILSILVVTLLVIGISRFFQQLAEPPQKRGSWTKAASWTAAFRPCPYCKGVLDRQGRCNIPGCPLYSPGIRANAPASARASFIPKLGIEAVPSSDGQNVAVSSVYAGGPAEMAGLAKNDIIIEFSGKKIRNPAQLRNMALLAQAESAANIIFIRNGIAKEIMIKVGEGEIRRQAAPMIW